MSAQFTSVIEDPPSLAAHHSLVAMACALLTHALILLWWGFVADDVEDIPVRVLHVKLGAGGDIFTQSTDTEQSAGGSQSQQTAQEATAQANAQSAQASSTASGATSSKDIITADDGAVSMAAMPKPMAKPVKAKPSKAQPERKQQPQIVPNRQTPAVDAKPAHQSAASGRGSSTAQGNGRARSGAGRQRFVRPAGSPLGEAGRKQADVIARYEQLLSAWIEKHKRYPRGARSRALEGRAIVRVRINRRGQVIFHRLELRTGHGLLDQAALDMVARANPVPSVPSGYPKGDMLEFLIPVSFRLQ